MYKIYIEGNDNNNSGNLLDGMDNVSTKIKALPKDQINKASAEIEKGEYVMNPNTFSLHKALGKRHSKGGTPVNIPDNSFIFSDFKDLGFNKNDKERFEFKMGGTKLKNNTPAKVLEKNLDVEHHNKMINILDSKKQDDIAKNSAQLMLQKNMNTIGKVAYVQEGKKSFPQGIPPFSQGTAPVYKKEVDDDITQSVQYMKQGGTVIPKYQNGKSTYNDRQRFWEQQGQLMLYPEIQWNGTQHSNNGIYDKANIEEFKKRNQWFFNKYPNADMRNPEDVDRFQHEYDNLYADQFNGEHYFEGNGEFGFDRRFGNHTSNAPAFVHNSYTTTSDYIDPNNRTTNTYSSDSPTINRNRLQQTMEDISLNNRPNIIGKQIPIETVKANISNSLNAGQATDAYTNQFKPVGFTPWQNFNMALPLLNKASIKSQYPLYQQQRSVAPELTLQSADPYLNQIGMDYNQAANMNRAMSPTQSYANNSEMYGKKLDASNQAISAVNQGNSQIQNQQNQLVANTYNTDMMNNLKFNKNYYDELSTTIQNKQRYKDYYNSQFMDNANKMIAENQAFNNILGSQQTYNGKPLYTPVSNGFGYSMALTPGLNIDLINGQQYGQGNSSVDINDLRTRIDEAYSRGDYRAAASLENTLQRYRLPQKKKGGFIPKFKL